MRERAQDRAPCARQEFSKGKIFRERATNYDRIQKAAEQTHCFLPLATTADPSDDDILLGMYERTLARRPSDEEMKICRRYIQKVNNRQEALEDLFWSLINTTEFLTKR